MTPYLMADLKRDEGCRLVAYPDPRSGGAPWTIGYGHTGREVHPGLIIGQEQAEDYLAQDITLTCRGLDTALPGWRRPEDPRQDVIVNMAFNLGVHKLLGFHNLLAALKSEDYDTAAAEMLDSAWALELPARADRLARQMRTGRRA